jgi:hypothetical protein
MAASARSILRTSCVLLASGAGLFLLLELSARVSLFGLAGLSPAQINSLRGLPQSGFTQPSPEPRLGFELRPNLAGTFKLAPFRTNAQGQRDRDYPLRKPERTFRVAVVGSSFALPAGVAIEDAFHSLLEERCARELAPGGCEFINFAVGMYNPEQVLAMLELRALAYQPDLVLMTATRLSMPWLAHDPRSAEGRARRRLDPATLPRFERSYPVLRSFLLRLVAARLGAAPAAAAESLGWLERAAMALAERTAPAPPRAAPRGPLPPPPRGSVIERLAQIGRERRIPIALVLLEFEDRPRLPVDAEVAAAAQTAGIPYLDTRDAFRGTRARDYWIYELDPHPNAKAHAVFAQVVATFLRSNGLLPKPPGP